MNVPPLRVAFSPCPNDTFIFHALVHGLVPDAPRVDVTYADVDLTNDGADSGDFDLVKVSYAALPWLLEKYELLPCGGAVGRGCGPLVVTRDGDDTSSLAGRSVAVPGDRTTSYLLLRMWAGREQPSSVTIMPFHKIMPAVAAGRFDAGLVIHEGRFTYHQYGVSPIVDLGAWWEQDTGLPVPLGAIVIKRGGIDPRQAAEWVRASVRHAWADPESTQEYVLSHSQELDPRVVSQHIELYVNSFTENLSAEGYAAADRLLSRAAAEGYVPPLTRPLRG